LDVDVEMGVENGRLLAYLAAHGEVLSKRYNENQVVVHCRIPSGALAKINGNGTQVRPHLNGTVTTIDR
jgi:GTP-binding protein HflX